MGWCEDAWLVGIGCGCVAIVEKDVVLWVRFVAGKKYYLLFWKGGAVHASDLTDLL